MGQAAPRYRCSNFKPGSNSTSFTACFGSGVALPFSQPQTDARLTPTRRASSAWLRLRRWRAAKIGEVRLRMTSRLSAAISACQALPYTVRLAAEYTPRVQSPGARIRAARQAAGLTQDQFADLLDVSKATVSAWERDVDRPRFDLLASVRAALRTSLDWLVCGDDDEALAAWASKRAAIAEGAPTAYATWGAESQAQDAAEVQALQTFRALSLRRRQAFLALFSTER